MKLSSLKPGKLYHVHGDFIDVVLQVVTPGVSPTCILKWRDNGFFKGFKRDSRELFVQLIGWLAYDESALGPKGIQLFVLDTQPESDSLLAVYADNKGGTSTLMFPSLTIAPL